jgi:hypothetical protein
VSHYPWSLLWRSGDPSPYVAAVIDTAQQLAHRLGWLETTGPPADLTSGRKTPTVIGPDDEPSAS